MYEGVELHLWKLKSMLANSNFLGSICSFSTDAIREVLNPRLSIKMSFPTAYIWCMFHGGNEYCLVAPPENDMEATAWYPFGLQGHCIILMIYISEYILVNEVLKWYKYLSTINYIWNISFDRRESIMVFEFPENVNMKFYTLFLILNKWFLKYVYQYTHTHTHTHIYIYIYIYIYIHIIKITLFPHILISTQL